MLDIEITDPNHLADYWMGLGMLEAHQYAVKKAKECKVVGMGLMADLLQANAARTMERVKLQNIMLAFKNGFDPDTSTLVLKNVKGRVFIAAEPLQGAEGNHD